MGVGGERGGTGAIAEASRRESSDLSAKRHFHPAPCLSEVLSGDPPHGCGVRVRKLVLAGSEVAELLDLLAVERVSRAHLMPTYDNVAITALTLQASRDSEEYQRTVDAVRNWEDVGD